MRYAMEEISEEEFTRKNDKLDKQIEKETLAIAHYQGLLNKINNRSEFRANEIQALYDLLGLTEEERVAIFFAC